jgi:hypothetical protein
LACDHPNVPRYRQELAWCLSNIGAIQAESSSPVEAVRLQQERRDP